MYIVGAGALGSLWAAKFQQAGESCEFLFDQTYMDRKRLPQDNNGSALTETHLASLKFRFKSHPDIDGKTHALVDIPCHTVFSALPDDGRPILVCTKSYHLESALQPLQQTLSGRTLVLFQNGYGVQDKIAQQLSSSAVYAAVTTEGAHKVTSSGETLITHAGLGHTSVGPLNERASQHDIAPLINQLASSGLSVRADQDVRTILLRKLVINCSINPFTAILGCKNGEITQSRLFKSVWPHLKHELWQFCQLQKLEFTEQQIDDFVMDVVAKTAENRSSMLQDIQAGRMTEIEHINGYVFKHLKVHGLPCSANQKLYEDVLMKRSDETF